MVLLRNLWLPKCIQIFWVQHRLIINPSCPYLECSPDRRVFDATADPQFGLPEIKCSTPESITDIMYLQVKPNGKFQLKPSHQCFCQVHGQMGITGAKWCDQFVKTHSNYHCELFFMLPISVLSNSLWICFSSITSLHSVPHN